MTSKVSKIFLDIICFLLFSACSSRAIEYSEILRSKILDLCSLSHLHIFCDIVQLQYVGTATYNSNQMMSDILLSLSNLKLAFRFKGNLITLTPDDLYRRYIQYFSLLPSDAMTWSLSLVTLFYHAVPLDLQDAIVKDSYQLPNISFLTTKPLQTTALQDLREHAVIMYKNLADETKRIKKILSFHLYPCSQSDLIDSTNFHYSNSQVELTIE